MNHRSQVRSFWICENGLRQSVTISEADAHRQLATRAASCDDSSVNWTIDVESIDVPMVRASSIFDAPEEPGGTGGTGGTGDPGGTVHHWHAVWDCPHCARKHVTDIDSSDLDTLQELWFCERGMGLALVSWPGAK